MPSILSFIFLLLSLSFIFPANCSAQVVINEVYTPTDSDWVELYNTSDQNIDISGWILDDKGTSSNMKVIDEGTIIKSGGFKVFDVGNRLNKGGDKVILFVEKDGPENPKDELEYDQELDEGFSFGCYPDGLGDCNEVLSPLTKGETNSPITLTPTENPTDTPTPTPTPPNDPTVTAEITNKDSIQVGVMFYIDCSVADLEPNQRYQLKAIIGQDPDDKYKGETRSANGDEWLHYTSDWDKFPLIETNENGTIDGVQTLRARIKEGNPDGKYYVQVAARKDGTVNKVYSAMHEIKVSLAPTPTPTEENTPTPTPTKKQTTSSDSEDENNLSLTATKEPTSDFSPTPTPTSTDSRDQVLGLKSKNDKDDKNPKGEPKVLGDASLNKTYLRNKAISLGLVSIGGLFISSVLAWPYIQKIFATIKKDGE